MRYLGFDSCLLISAFWHMSDKQTKLRYQKKLQSLPFLIVYLGFYLILSSCQSISSVTDEAEQRPLAELIVLEMAIQRQESETVKSTINGLTKRPLSNETYIYLYRLLKTAPYTIYQDKLVASWSAQYPDEQRAQQAKLSLALCEEPSSAAAQLVEFLQVNNDVILERFMTCLTDENRAILAQLLFASLPNDPRVQLLYINGLIDSGQSDKGLSEINSIEPAERSVAILKILGKIQFDNNDLNAARATYQQLVQILPFDRNINFVLAEILYDQQAYETALPYLQRVLQQSANDRPGQYLTAASHYALGNWPESEFWFLKLLTSSDYRNRAFYYLGEIAVQREQFTEAIEYFTKVRRSDYFLSAQLQLWRIIARDQPELASMGFQQLAKEFPRDRLVIQMAAIELLDKSGKTHEALQELTNLADDYPNNLRLQLLRVRWLVEQGRLDNITQNVLASLSGLPELDSQFQLLESAVFYLISQDVAQPAIEILEFQESIPRHNSRYVFLEGVANAINGNYQIAIQGLEQLLQLAPGNAAYLNALGYTLTLSGERYDEAKELIERALVLDPENAAYLDSLAWVYFAQGNATKALSIIKQALSIEQSASLYSHLIEILISQGELEKAQQELSKAAGLFPRNRVLSMLQEQL